MMNHLCLFSGIGGFSLGLERTGGFKTVAFCDNDAFCQKILKKHWPDVPIYDDVRNLEHEGSVDIITGGYPCQPFSVAGKQKGKEDERHLWPAMFNIIKKHKPRWVIGENVAGHINMGINDVLNDLEREGYTVRTFVIPACAVNAPHRRDRVWIVAHSQHNGQLASERRGGFKKAACKQQEGEKGTFNATGTGSISEAGSNVANTKKLQRNGKQNNPAESARQKPEPRNSSGKEDVADSNSNGLQGRTKEQIYGFGDIQSEFIRSCEEIGRLWAVEPDVGRVANGIPGRVDRLKSLGNAVVPQIPEILGNAILKVEEMMDNGFV